MSSAYGNGRGTVWATAYGNGRGLFGQPLMEMERDCLAIAYSNSVLHFRATVSYTLSNSILHFRTIVSYTSSNSVLHSR